MWNPDDHDDYDDDIVDYNVNGDYEEGDTVEERDNVKYTDVNVGEIPCKMVWYF